MIIVLSVILIGALGYKIFEWRVTSDLVKQVNEDSSQEIKLISSYSIWAAKTQKLNEQYGSDKNSQEESNRLYNDRNSMYTVLKDASKEYMARLKEDNAKLQKIKSFLALLSGRKKDTALDLINLKEKFYTLEIQATEDNLAYTYLTTHIIQVENDQALLLEHVENIEEALNFQEISRLEKYTNPDFKFEQEGLIIKYYPEGAKTLRKYKDYFDSYYRIVKDLVKEDEESAAYKLSKFRDTAAELNIDRDAIFSENAERINDRQKNILKLLIDQVSLIKKIENERIFDYPPPLTSKTFTEEDLSACQAYYYKTLLYWATVGHYPSSLKFDGYVREMNSLPPKTDEFDEDVFKTGILSISNDPKEIKIKCLDRQTNRSVLFGLYKSTQ